MGLTLPEEVAWVLGLLGFNWPMADEVQIVEAVVLPLREFGVELDHVHGWANAVIASVGAENSGGSVHALHQHWHPVGGPGGHIAQLRGEVEIVADVLEVYAGVVLATKLAIIAQLVALAAELTAATVAAVASFGVAAAAEPGLLAGARILMRETLDKLEQHVEQEVGKRLEGLFKQDLKKLLVRELKGTLEGVAWIGGYDLVKQELEVNVFHTRKDFNWGELAEASAAGALAGAVTVTMRASRQPSREEQWRNSLNETQEERQMEYDSAAKLRARHLESGNPLTGDLAKQIRDQKAGSVKFIDRRIIDPQRGLNDLTDFDIETDNAVIQVKSGTAQGMTHQIQLSETVTDKPVIGYAPDANAARFGNWTAVGVQVFRDPNDLIAYLLTLQ